MSLGPDLVTQRVEESGRWSGAHLVKAVISSLLQLLRRLPGPGIRVAGDHRRGSMLR